ncbi:MAG: hypothetical protein QOJ98_182 [Acidobacteriota bacterium]|jgi:hypothetical protein|nr:hypothetical protein [Acidobacteriota bacterium]
MRHVGFSTGALAKGDFVRALELQKGNAAITAVELSALRDHELAPLLAALPRLDLAAFRYVSFHGPSKLTSLSEDDLVEALHGVPRGWPIVVHPDVIRTPARWRELGSRLCLENMDNRKAKGRTVAEMRELFEALPDATFCLDLGHARQIDPTMALAFLMLAEFGHRLVQLHVSEVGPSGEHLPVRSLAALAFRRVAHRVPSDCALIIESVIAPADIDSELSTVSRLFDREAELAIG